MADNEHPAQFLAALFAPENRKYLLSNPADAVSKAGGPDELGAFLAGLSRGERHVLIDTWDHMSEQGNFTYDLGGVTVAFL